jgi:chemotaxis signal transduction protein
MTPASSRVASRAAALKRDFDQSFALPPATDTAAKVDLLAIRLGSKTFAIRLAEIAGLFADKKITRVPGAGTAMLGIAGFRGSIVPVYDLQCLLGEPAGKTARWLVIALAAPVAFAFDGFEGQLRVAPEAIKPQDTQARQGLTNDLVHTDGVLRPIIRLPSVLDAIKT